MPLNGQTKRIAGQFNGFDQPIRGEASGSQIGSKPIDTLMVQAVDSNLGKGYQGADLAVSLETYRMSKVMAGIFRCILVAL